MARTYSGNGSSEADSFEEEPEALTIVVSEPNVVGATRLRDDEEELCEEEGTGEMRDMLESFDGADK